MAAVSDFPRLFLSDAMGMSVLFRIVLPAELSMKGHCRCEAEKGKKKLGKILSIPVVDDPSVRACKKRPRG